MKKSLIVIIVIIVILNICLLFKINFLHKTIKTTKQNNYNLTYTLQKHKEYIIENIEGFHIDYSTIYNIIKPKQQLKDTTFVLLVPSDVCMACASSLFNELNNIKIKDDRICLVSEKPFEKLKREWYAHNYKSFFIVQEHSIFKKNIFNSKIIIIKIIESEKQLHYFIYDPELYEYLIYFMQ